MSSSFYCLFKANRSRASLVIFKFLHKFSNDDNFLADSYNNNSSLCLNSVLFFSFVFPLFCRSIFYIKKYTFIFLNRKLIHTLCDKTPIFSVVLMAAFFFEGTNKRCTVSVTHVNIPLI
jgi:hypothetical protein